MLLTKDKQLHIVIVVFYKKYNLLAF